MSKVIPINGIRPFGPGGRGARRHSLATYHATMLKTHRPKAVSQMLANPFNCTSVDARVEAESSMVICRRVTSHFARVFSMLACDFYKYCQGQANISRVARMSKPKNPELPHCSPKDEWSRAERQLLLKWYIRVPRTTIWKRQDAQ